MTRKAIPYVLFSLMAGFFVFPAAAEHPELSGVWRLEVTASQFGAMTPVDSGVMTISTGPHKMIDIRVSTMGAHSERTVESQWKIDDHYHPVLGDSSGEVLAKWEGAVLTGKRLTPGGTVEETRFRLEEDGATLTETVQNGLNITTLVWRRE